MKTLSEKEWKQFSAFGEESTLNVKSTNSSIDKVALIDDDEKVVPYITRSGINNGLEGFVSPKNCQFGSDNGNCITIGLDTQTAYYQPFQFVTGQNIHVVTGEKLNENVAHFLVPILRSQMFAKFNWGGNGATIGRLNKLTLMLPIDEEDKPDYDYMSEYSSKTKAALIQRYREYVNKRIRNLEFKTIPSLKKKGWKEFRIGELFSAKRPKARTIRGYESGNIPFITSGAFNNGVVDCFKPKENEDLDSGNCITVSPVDGSAFYQPMDFLGRGGAGSSIIMLRNQDLNLYSGEFIAKMIAQICKKFTYGRMGSKESIEREYIMLPVTDSGEPDYPYMEQYIKNLMLKKYQQYLTYLNKKQSAA